MKKPTSKQKRAIAVVLTSLAFAFCSVVLAFSSLFVNVDRLVEVFNTRPIDVVILSAIGTFLYILGYTMVSTGKKGYAKFKNFMIVMTVIFFTLVVCLAVDMYFGPYAYPFAIAGLFIETMVNKRSALYSQIIMGIFFLIFYGCMGGVNNDILIPILSGVFSGIVFSTIIAKNTKRMQTILSVIASIPVYVITTVALYLLLKGNSEVVSLYDAALNAAISPVITGFMYLGILPVFEAIFKVITTYHLTEITDISKGLLFELSIKAPGTFNHSMSVGNLAAACALAIGEDAQLARACGYYHDIGKMIDPTVFTENQTVGMSNPHDKLTPELSVSLIKRHVMASTEILKKEGFSPEIISAAIEHHGTMPITYFYTKAKKFTDGFVDIKDYSYDGPRPTTKINAIMMIVDASEAAVRSLKDRTKETIDDKVRSIIEERMDLEQFDDCAITFKDLKKIRYALVDNLCGVYHERISYPKLRITKNQENKTEEELKNY